MIRAAACLVLMVGASVLGAERVDAGVSVGIKAGMEKDFGRISFTLNPVTKIDATLNAGVLVVSFADPVSLSTDGIVEQMSDYVSAARLDPNGRTLRLALERTCRINTMAAGNRVFLDLMPPDWKGPPPQPPEDVIRELSDQAATAETRLREAIDQINEAKPATKLAINVGEQPTFTRLIFDWQAFTPTRLYHDGNRVRIAFDQKGEADLRRFKTDPPRFIRSAESAATRRGLDVTFDLDEGVDIRGFREGMTYVLDLTGKSEPARAKGEPIASAPAKPAPASDSSRTGFVQTTMVPLPLDVNPESFGDLRTPILDPAKAHAENQKLVPAAGVSGGAKTPAKVAASAKLGLAEASLVPVKPAPKAPPKMIAAKAEKVAGQLRVTFPFEDRVASAAFRRGRSLWLVFDSEAEIRLDGLVETGSAWIRTIAKGRSGAMQYVRIDLSKTWLATVEAGEDDWVITIGDMVGESGQSLSLIRSLRTDKRSMVTVELRQPGRVHWLQDPDIGDTIAVVTAYPPNRSVGKSQEFVDFRALETVQGIAIEPRSDDLAVRLGIDQVLITRENGLNVSGGEVAQYAPGRKPLADNSGFNVLHADRKRPADSVNNAASAMIQDIAAVDAPRRNEKRMKLAGLYLGEGLSAEALGVLRQIAAADGGSANDPAFNAFRGSANVLMNRPQEALKDLDVHALVNDVDAALWRGLAYAEQKNPSEALKAFGEGSAALSRYAPDMQARFRLAAARAALDSDQPDRVAAELSGLDHVMLPASLAAQTAVLNAHYLARIGRTNEALGAYQTAMNSGIPGVAAEAELGEIQLARKSGKLELKPAIEKLERLRLVWRGDVTELATIAALAGFYVEDRNYRTAFGLMKEAVLAFPNAQAAQQLQDRMQAAFQDLYLHGHADSLSTVDALSLYYEFRAMTPVGPLGDELIRNLSDRLIDLDLLDQAAGLLEYQVDKRLKGAAKAQIATKLAMVRLMNRQPEAALRVIRRTRQAGLPDDLQQGRDLLEARALGELGRVEAAQEMLSGLTGPEAERIRADTLWSAQQWKRAGEQFEKMLGERWQDSPALTDAERFDTMRGAISFALAEDRVSVDRLRKKFTEKMAKTADAESFFLVTQATDPSNADFRQLARNIASVDTLDAFMKEYRAHYDGAEPALDRANASDADGGAG